MADFTSVAMLTASSRYKDTDFQMDTGFPQSENVVQFLLARDGTNDLFVIKKARTRSQRTEVDIYIAAGGYQTVLEWITALDETDHSWTFALASNRDLLAIRKSDNCNDHTQLHVLSYGSDYGSFLHQWSILPGEHKLGHDYEFVVDSKDNLWVIKKLATTTAIRYLSAASAYQEFASAGKPWVTAVTSRDFTWKFLGVDVNEDVWVVNKKERSLCLLTKKSAYEEMAEVKLESSKLEVPRFDRRCSFAVAPTSDLTKEDPSTFDLYVFNTSRTSSGNVTFQVVEKPFHHRNIGQTVIRPTVDIGPLAAGDESAFSWITRSTKSLTDDSGHTDKGGKGVEESYLRIVKKVPTWPPNGPVKFVTQVSFYRESYRFQGPGLKINTAWPATRGDTCEFLFADNMDMYVIKKSNCESKKVEVYVLSWASRYTEYTLRAITPMEEGAVDHTWTFLLADNRDLICIQKSTTTECWRLLHDGGPGKLHYSTWSKRTDNRGIKIAQTETDDSWEFLLAPKTDDLYAIQKYGDKNCTKIKVLPAESDWTKISDDISTGLKQTDYNYSFCLTTDRNLVAVQKSRFPCSEDMASI